MNKIVGWIYKCVWKNLQPVIYRTGTRIVFEAVPVKKIDDMVYVCPCNFYKNKRKDRLRKNNCKPIKVDLIMRPR